MIIPFKTFTGEFPRTAAHLLPDHAAQYALNCDFLSGSLKGLKKNDPVVGSVPLGTKSMFVYDSANMNTFYWTRDVDAVRSPVVNDAYSRFYWSDGTGFYVSRGDIGGGGEPSERYKVGVPRPATPVSATANRMTFFGVTAFSVMAGDELADGTLANSADVGVVIPTYNATSTVISFTGPTPAEATQSSSSTTVTSPASSNWRYAGAVTTTVNGVATGTYSLYSPVDAAPFTILGTLFGNDLVVYYDNPIATPASISVAMEDTGFGTFYRLGNTYWYGNKATITPPTAVGPTAVVTSSTTTTTTEAAVVGPIAVLSLTKEDGSVITARVRQDSNKTSWPADFPGMSASLAISGTQWTVTITVQGSYVERRAYVCTYVNDYGEEGAPSDPYELDCAENAVVTLQYAPPQTGYKPITKVRFYRAGAESSGQYLYVGQTILSSGYGYVDAVRNEALGHTLDTMNYYPPDQTLRGICVMANGMVVGFKGNEVHFMEPYLPYACNPAAIKPLPHKIKGVCPFEGGLYVTTTAEPYIIQGAAPEFMTDMRLPAVQAGVSKGSICNYNGTVVYASNDGLVMLQGTQVSLDMSFKFFSRSDWQSRYGAHLQNMRLNVHDGSLLVWFDNGFSGFVLRFEEEAPSLTEISYAIQAAFNHPLADSLYVVQGTKAYVFRSLNDRTSFMWTSKEFVLPKPTNFGVLQLIGSGELGIELIADGATVVLSTEPVDMSGGTLVRLPSGFLARRWSLGLFGTENAEIQEAYLANSITELQGV